MLKLRATLPTALYASVCHLSLHILFGDFEQGPRGGGQRHNDIISLISGKVRGQQFLITSCRWEWESESGEDAIVRDRERAGLGVRRDNT